MRWWLVVLWVLAGSVGGRAWTPEQWFPQAKSPRIANYRIEASLDWDRKRLDGQEVITWRNAGTAATSEFPLHLYLNAFKGPSSLFMKESGGQLREDEMGDPGQPGSWGYCLLKSVTLLGQPLTWHAGEDESVAWVRLPRAIHPGESIQVAIAWEAQFPQVFARSGWGNGRRPGEANFLMGAQWFPKVGVYQGDRWHCQAYHGNAEFFADFGTYDVVLSLGNRLTLAHTGTAIPYQSPEGGQYDAAPDPKRPLSHLWTLHAEDVHDFAFAVMPKSAWRMSRRVYRGVQVFYFYQPENGTTLPRQQEAVEWALRLSGDWFLPYPYPVLTVVDVPEGAKGADGMEYPTLFTASSVAFDPWHWRDRPEDLAIHEFGHQVFQGLLASNEVDEPWLDEGLTSWFTHRVVQRGYQGLLTTRRFSVGSEFLDWLSYWDGPSVDPLTQTTPGMMDGASYGRTAYAKPALVMEQLEALLGRPVLERAMRTYAQEMAFRHPTAQDLRRVLERVSGRDLGTFWRDYVEGTEVLDFRILAVRTTEVTEGGWMSGAQGMTFVAPQAAAPGKRGSITLVRRGGIQTPITLWVRLENRDEQRLVWDGRERWITFEFEQPVVQAVLDPDGNYPMLKDRLHATYTQKPTRRGFHYWAQLVWGGVATLLQGAGLG